MNLSFIDRDLPSLGVYFKEIRKYPLLSVEEENAAFRHGDRDKLILSNLRFVISIAREYEGRGLSLSDLISEGNMGLIIAVDKFDVTKGVRFLTYAVWWIRQSIMNALSSTIIRLPENKRILYAKLRAVMDSSDILYSSDDLEEATGLSLDTISSLLSYGNNIVSLDVTDQQTHVEFDDSMLLDEFRKHIITYLLSYLNKRERYIIEHYFGLGYLSSSIRDLSDEFKLSQERIRQIKRRALKKMSRYGKKILKD